MLISPRGLLRDDGHPRAATEVRAVEARSVHGDVCVLGVAVRADETSCAFVTA